MVELVEEHIRSFKGRVSHYSLKKSRKLYLPETLNIKKMYLFFREKHPARKISYESYRLIFTTKFNIGFGYPRSDTCSYCDEVKVRKASLETQLKNIGADNQEKKSVMEKQLRTIETEHKLHKLKAETFYNRKRNAKKNAQKQKTFEAITMDYSKNLPTPNITTNDVYYKRQLTFISFNIHILSSAQSIFYTYPQTVAKKGSDDVVSLLNHFCFNFLDAEVRHLEIFCDSCAGQNKNFTLLRFLHYLVHKKSALIV